MESTEISIAAHFVKKKLFHKTKNDDQLSGSQGTKFARIAMAAVCSYGGSGLAGCAGNGDVQLRCYLYFFIFRF